MEDEEGSDLDDDDIKALVCLVNAIEEFRDFDGKRITDDQMRVLLSAMIGNGKIAAMEIEEKTNVQTSLVSRTIRRFVKVDGDKSSDTLFYYRISPVDNRSLNIYLTGRGLGIAKRLAAKLKGLLHATGDNGTAAN